MKTTHKVNLKFVWNFRGFFFEITVALNFKYHFIMAMTQLCPRLLKNHTAFAMSGQDWIDINEFSKNVGLSFLFDVNVLIRDVENKWSSSNARKLLKFSSKQGFDDITWELGNEPNSLKVVKSQRVFFNLVSSRKKNKKN